MLICVKTKRYQGRRLNSVGSYLTIQGIYTRFSFSVNDAFFGVHTQLLPVQK